jgi:hypothetical protein
MARKHSLSTPQLFFVIGTRAALGAGIGLLAGNRLSSRAKRAAGLTLALIGAATTFPAARIVLSKPSLWHRVKHAVA